MYYTILHIPTGHYMYNGHGTPIRYDTINEAEDSIERVCNPNNFHLSWNDYNEDIGNPTKIEFEIIFVSEDSND